MMKQVCPVSLVLLLLLLLAAHRAVGEDEGSGQGQDGGGEVDMEEDDDQDSSLEGVVVPSRVIPSLQSPAPGLPGESPRRPSGPAPPPQPNRTRIPPEDAIYIEEGSGDGGRNVAPSTTPLFAPSSSSSGPFSSSATPQMPPMTPKGPREEVIVTNRLSNSPPVLQKKLIKIPVTAGKTKRWRVPEDTFFDHEDGNTRNLRLSLRYPNGSLVRDDYWIRFDNASQEAWILPVNENDIGRWKFQLSAQDKQGQSVEDVLEIVVRQFSGSRLLNHGFEMSFSFTTWQPSVLKNWEWKVLDRIRQLFRNPSFDNILVRSIQARPYSISWTNSSLIQQSCPKEEIQSLYQVMVDGTSSPSTALKSALGDTVFVKSIVLKYYGSCLEEASLNNPSGGGGGPGGGGGSSGDNSVPVIRNPIDRINITAGELLRFRVPEDTCYDREDGSTSRLSLHLLTMSRKELSPKSWLRFDARNQEFYGVPLEEEVGREEYQMVCSDRSGLSAIDGIEISVLNRPFSERFGVEFSFSFHADVSDKRVELVELIASYFGDSTPRNVIVKSISDNKFVWYNKSLSANAVGCNDEKLEWMRKQISGSGVGPDGSGSGGGGSGGSGGGGSVSQALSQHFRLFPLSNASVMLRGSCSFTTSLPEVTQKTHQTIFHGIIPSSEYLMTFLIPAVIISCMLLLAILLACILHRKRKAGKLNLFYNETLPPRVPVILQDELLDEHDLPFRSQQLPSSSSHHGRPEEDRLIQGTRIVLQGGDPMARPTPTYRKA